jgi:hypothetical protein
MRLISFLLLLAFPLQAQIRRSGQYAYEFPSTNSVPPGWQLLLFDTNPLNTNGTARIDAGTFTSNAGTNQVTLASIFSSLGVVAAMKWGDNTMASNTPGYPFAHPTNAWNYLVGRGSNNWTMLIGPGLWEVSPGYVDQGQLAAFDADNLSNVKILGSGPSTIITNSRWGDIFNFGTNSNGIEIGGFQIQQPRTGVAPIVTNGVISNQISTVIYNQTDDITLSSNYYIHDITFNPAQNNVIFLRANNVLVERLQCFGAGTTNLMIANNPMQADGSVVSGAGSHWVVRNCYFWDVCYGVEVGGHPSGFTRTNRNWLIDGVTTFSWFQGLVLFSSSGNRFENVRFQNCFVSSMPGNTNLTVPTGARDGPCNAGILIGPFTYDVKIVDCHIRNAMVGIRTKPEGGDIRNLSVKNNYIYSDGWIRNFAPDAHEGIRVVPDTDANLGLYNIYDSFIEGNTVYGVPTYAINIGGTNIIVKNNTVIDAAYDSAFGSAFLVSPNQWDAGMIKIGNMVFEGNTILAHNQATDYGILIGAGVTNVVWRNNRHIGSGARLGWFGTPGLFTNTTWNAMWGLEGTNFSVGVPY